MKTVVFDIETVGLPWLAIDPLLRESITRGAADGEAYRSRKDWRSLSPYASKIVVIAVLNPETSQGMVWYEKEGDRTSSNSEDGLFERIGCDEKTMLAEFWGILARFERVVSFNGRSFDGPFLSVRSAIHGVRPSKNLSGYRYSIAEHVDLLEVLSFQGAAPKPNLHGACVAFGIPSPKSTDMHGYSVGEAYQEGRLNEILEYCRRDVEATAELFRRLDATLLPLFRR